MNQPTIEQIRTVSEYDECRWAYYEDAGIKEVRIKSADKFTYHTDLNQIAPVYRKLLWELDEYVKDHDEEEYAEQIVSVVHHEMALGRAAKKLDALAIFNACYDAILFIQKHSNEKDNNPA